MRQIWAITAAALLASAGGAQVRPALRHPGTPGYGGGGHKMTAKGFSIKDGVTTSITFLVVTDPNQSGRGVARTTLTSGQSQMFPCGGFATPCYVRFAANGALQTVAVQWHHAYQFEWQGKHFDLYDLTPDS